MKYTISKEADKKISKDMEVIVKELKKRIPGVLSIILTGGFSRGKGPVKKINRKWYPYNDYDIQVIAKKKFSKKQTDKISIEISKLLNYKGVGYFYNFKKEEQKLKENFYIDLKLNTPKELKNLLPRIRNYELRNKSLLLWGKDLRQVIPSFLLKDVPLSDGGKLLLDRLSQLIQYYSVERKHDDEFLSYIIQQAYAACCTSLLLLSKKYKIGYTRAMKIFKENYKVDFPELYKEIPDLHLKIEQFINWKENPVKLPNENIEEEWFIAKKNILEVSKYFFSRFLNKRIENPDELSNAILNMQKKFYYPYLKIISKKRFRMELSKVLLPFVSLIMKYKYYRRLNKMGIKMPKIFFRKSPVLIIFASLIYISDSLKEGGVDKRQLEKGKKLLSLVYPVKSENWEDISLDYGNSYIAFFMQKL